MDLARVELAHARPNNMSAIIAHSTEDLHYFKFNTCYSGYQSGNLGNLISKLPQDDILRFTSTSIPV